MNRSEMLQLYADGYKMLKQALSEFPSESLHYKPSPEEWSIHEIVIHIADSEANSYIRCRKLIAENGSAVSTYNQDTWALELDYAGQKTKNALKLFKYLRKATTSLLNEVPELTWNTHAIVHPEYGSITLDDWLRTYSNHIPLHIRQMKRTFKAWEASQ